jgi:hypothetical protein
LNSSLGVFRDRLCERQRNRIPLVRRADAATAHVFLAFQQQALVHVVSITWGARVGVDAVSVRYVGTA